MSRPLVLDDKWQATVANRVSAEVEALTLALVARIRELGERYAETLGALDAEIKNLRRRLHDILRHMGVK